MQISNRVFWAGVFLLGCCIVSLGAYAGQEQQPLRQNGTIYARRFVLMDGAGHEVADLSCPGSDSRSGPELSFYNPGSKSSSLNIGLVGLAATARSAGDKGQPYISLQEAKSGKLQVHLGADADVGPSLFFYGTKNNDSFTDLLALAMNPLTGPQTDLYFGKKAYKIRSSGPAPMKIKPTTTEQ